MNALGVNYVKHQRNLTLLAELVCCLPMLTLYSLLCVCFSVCYNFALNNLCFNQEEKKMIRYRDGQVVSTKGERYSEVKRDVSDEMKKTFINLKPARQYRFH